MDVFVAGMHGCGCARNSVCVIASGAKHQHSLGAIQTSSSRGSSVVVVRGLPPQVGPPPLGTRAVEGSLPECSALMLVSITGLIGRLTPGNAEADECTLAMYMPFPPCPAVEEREV